MAASNGVAWGIVDSDLLCRLGGPGFALNRALEAAAANLSLRSGLSDRDTEAYVRGLHWLALGRRIECRSAAVLVALASDQIPNTLLAVLAHCVDATPHFDPRSEAYRHRVLSSTGRVIALGRRLGVALAVLAEFGF